MTQRSNECYVRILGIDGDPPDGMRVGKAIELPRLTRVDGLVNPVTTHDVAANASLSGSDIDDIRIRFRNRDCSNRRGRIFLFVENWLPVKAAIGGLPHASGDGAKIIDIILTYNSRNGSHAPTAKGSDQPILQTLPGPLVLIVILVFVFILISPRARDR